MAAYTSVLPGAPTSGNFVVGDTVTDNNGTVWQCTVGGFDAKWVAAPTGLSPTETAVLDGVTAGTQAAGKAVVANSDVNTGVSKVTQLHVGTSGSEAQMFPVTAGTATASKPLVLDANKHVDILGLPVSGLKIGVSGSEIAVTATGADMNLNTNQPSTIATTATPASGTCAVSLILRKSDGATALTHAVSGIGHIGTAADGLTSAAITSVATGASFGEIVTLVTGRVFHFTTTATGALDLALTAAAGTYYVTLVMPNGKLVTSSACVSNA